MAGHLTPQIGLLTRAQCGFERYFLNFSAILEKKSDGNKLNPFTENVAVYLQESLLKKALIFFENQPHMYWNSYSKKGLILGPGTTFFIVCPKFFRGP